MTKKKKKTSQPPLGTEKCRSCGEDIRMQIQRDTGYCSQRCAKRGATS